MVGSVQRESDHDDCVKFGSFEIRAVARSIFADERVLPAIGNVLKPRRMKNEIRGANGISDWLQDPIESVFGDQIGFPSSTMQRRAIVVPRFDLGMDRKGGGGRCSRAMRAFTPAAWS